MQSDARGGVHCHLACRTRLHCVPKPIRSGLKLFRRTLGVNNRIGDDGCFAFLDPREGETDFISEVKFETDDNSSESLFEAAARSMAVERAGILTRLPNKALEPTRTAVTPHACACVAPAARVAHL